MKSTQREELAVPSLVGRSTGISNARNQLKTSKQPASTPTPYLDLDQFKFRIVEREGLHFFKDVRFNVLHVSNVDKVAIIEFFEGRELESLSSKTMDERLEEVSILPNLKELIFDLQSVLCS